MEMFSRLPQKISVPFNILGDEAKLAFRSQPGGIAKLASTRDIPETDSYWNQYIVLFDSTSDVFSLISPNDVRRALYEAPENVATLIRVITSRLFNLVSDHTFPTPPNASVASFATSFIKSSTGTQERNPTKEVLNCIRVLQRVFPVVFEIEGDTSRFEMEVLWKREAVKDDHVVEDERNDPQFVIEDDDDDEEGGTPVQSPSKPPVTSKPKEEKSLPSIVDRLLSCLIDLMFCCGFTLPSKVQVDHYKINYTIWEKGIGSTVDPGPSQAYEGNKTEVLRLLLVLLSKQIYSPPSALFMSPSLYTLHFVQKTPRRDVLTVLCSLINTTMNPSSATQNLMGGVAGKLPYNHLVFKGEDPRATLVSTCFQLLCAILDFQSGSARDVTTTHGENQTSAPTARTNAFRYFVAKLHRSSDFELILDGVTGILEAHMASINNLLPGSRKSAPYMVEAVVFFWKMIELNKKFRAHVVESDRGIDLISYLFCYGLEIKDKPEQHGVCRAVSYIIQTLSAEKAFGQKMSSPFKVQLPQKWSVMGSAGDFVINAVYSMVATTSGSLSSLYPAYIIALSNAAPYLKNLSVNSSARLIQLFTAFSNPSFLLSDEGHPRLLFFMLELFNAIIVRNLSDNPNLIYAIVRAHKTFEDLGTFTLARGLREIRRKQEAKEERARQADGAVDKGKRRAADEEQALSPHEEKARLLRHEQDSEAASAESLPPSVRQSISEEAPIPTSPPTSPRADGEEGLPMSEKARGKMRAGRSISDDMTGSLERLAATGIGRNGFVPTQEWVTSWQQGLPLDPILLMCSELVPKVQDLQSSLTPTAANSAVMDLLRSATLDHILPPAPAIAPRRFIWSDASIVWLSSLIWGEIYVRGMSPLGIWNTTTVRLFYVKQVQSQQRQITETVSNVVGGLLGRTDSSQSVRQRTQ